MQAILGCMCASVFTRALRDVSIAHKAYVQTGQQDWQANLGISAELPESSEGRRDEKNPL